MDITGNTGEDVGRRDQNDGGGAGGGEGGGGGDVGAVLACRATDRGRPHDL
jgi:hypothetical protein